MEVAPAPLGSCDNSQLRRRGGAAGEAHIKTEVAPAPLGSCNNSPFRRRGRAAGEAHLNMKVAPLGSCDNSPLRRGFTVAASTSQEFEFGMCAMVKDDLFMPAADVAPADVLFFQGQLLPLQQQDLRLEHTSEAPKTQEKQRQGRNGCPGNEWSTLSFCKARAESCLPCIAEHGLEVSTGGAAEEAGVCTIRDGVKVISEKEQFYGRVVEDSVSSSFRSNSGSSEQKGSSSSSTSSSRCSNGSLQDSSYFNGEVRKACCEEEETVDPQLHKGMKARWSWKYILGGLIRKAPKIEVDYHHRQSSWAEQGIATNQPQRSSGPFSFSPWHPRVRVKPPCPPEILVGCAKLTASSGNAHPRLPEAGPRCINPSSPTFPRPPIKITSPQPRPELSPSSIPSLLPSTAPFVGTTSLDLPSRSHTGTHPTSPSTTPPIGSTSIPKLRISFNLKRGWRRCLSIVTKKHHERVIKPPSHQDNFANDGEAVWLNMKAKSSSTTPLNKSPTRVCQDLAQASSKFNVGCASCPTSMCSSPHHSGVLAAVNKSTSDTLHDLHIVIQDAITHCKASQTQNLALS